MMNTWHDALFNVQSFLPDTSYTEHKKRQINNLESLLAEGKITTDYYQQEIHSLLEEYSTTGTAIYFYSNDQKLLLSADHVLRVPLYEYGVFDNSGNPYNKRLLKYVLPPMIRILPRFKSYADTLYEFKDFTVVREDIFDYTGIITRWPDADLTLWNLTDLIDNFDSTRIDEEYDPIDISNLLYPKVPDIGTRIFAIGFPVSVSNLHAEKFYGSDGTLLPKPNLTLPMTSWGRVGLSNPEFGFTYVDISVYPGNSGGPVIDIDSGKLIGIVSSQSSEQVMYNGSPTFLRHRIPFATIVNTIGISQLFYMHQAAVQKRDSGQ
ncbi:S1 family peptidase [Neolewinella maritima]|nr:serine protease [Neolewinella maritima]